MSERRWLYELTADEWFHLASENDESEIAPCCGNIGAIRDTIRELMIYQHPDDRGSRRILGEELLLHVEGDGEGHNLQDADKFPLLHKVLTGIKAELEEK